MASKIDTSETPVGWLSFEALCACTGLTESEVRIRIDRGEIEQLYRAGQKRYRLRRAEDVVVTTQSDPEEAWRQALTAFKARKDGGFLSRVPTVKEPAVGQDVEGSPEDEGATRAESRMRSWSRHPGWFLPNLESNESLV